MHLAQHLEEEAHFRTKQGKLIETKPNAADACFDWLTGREARHSLCKSIVMQAMRALGSLS
jgi:hypothetical protein